MTCLTTNLIKCLPVPSKDYKIYYDDIVRGFGVRVMSSGIKSFILRYSINGRDRKYTIGKYPDFSVVMARNKASKLRGQIAQGIDPIEKKRELANAMTLKDYSQYFIKTYVEKENSIGTKKCYTLLLKNHILQVLGNIKLNAINGRDVKRLHNKLSSIPYTANMTIALLSKMFNVAIKSGLCNDNPTKFVKKYKEHARDRVLSTEEMKRLIDTIYDYENETISYIFLFLMFTGARKAEVLNMKWEQISDQYIWMKPARATKQKRVHHVPLNRTCINLLNRMRRDANNSVGYIFINPKTKKPYMRLQFAWKTICERAGIENLRIHDLRHNFASCLVNAGENLYTIGKLLGHTNVTTTSRYSHHDNDTLRHASNKFRLVI